VSRAMKHHGTLPSLLDIEAFRAVGTEFFEQNTQAIFGIAFSDVSLVEVLQVGPAKAKLVEGFAELNGSEFQNAINCAAIAFEHVMRSYRTTREATTGTSLSDPVLVPFERDWRKDSRDLNEMHDMIESVRAGLELVALGIDYERYVSCKSRWPGVFFPMGRPEPVVVQDAGLLNVTREECERSLTFVIEVALRLQAR
jgi:hypothetical protein